MQRDGAQASQRGGVVFDPRLGERALEITEQPAGFQAGIVAGNAALLLGAALYGGRNKFKSFGSFDEKDSIFLKMRYQF